MKWNILQWLILFPRSGKPKSNFYIHKMENNLEQLRKTLGSFFWFPERIKYFLNSFHFKRWNIFSCCSCCLLLPRIEKHVVLFLFLGSGKYFQKVHNIVSKSKIKILLKDIFFSPCKKYITSLLYFKESNCFDVLIST